MYSIVQWYGTVAANTDLGFICFYRNLCSTHLSPTEETSFSIKTDLNLAASLHPPYHHQLPLGLGSAVIAAAAVAVATATMMGHISRNGPPSPWGTGETKKRIVDALTNENSDIHLYTGDISATGCAKVNYAKIRELYAPKHEMKNFLPNLKRLIENKMTKTGPFMVPAKNNESLSPWYTSSKKTSLVHTL